MSNALLHVMNPIVQLLVSCTCTAQSCLTCAQHEDPGGVVEAGVEVGLERSNVLRQVDELVEDGASVEETCEGETADG